MDLRAQLTDPRRYRAQIEQLHHRHLFTGRRAALEQDGVSLTGLVFRAPAMARRLARAVDRGTYELEPAHVRWIRPNGKDRRIYSCRLTDTIVHRTVAAVLEEAIAPTLSPALYSYRKGIGWWHAVGAFAAYVRAHRKARPDPRNRGIHVIRRDVDAYTDSIPVGATSPLWRLLREALARIDSPDPGPAGWRLIRNVIRPRVTLETGAQATLCRGVPTGQPISCVLFNLYLTELDRELERIPDAFYARYCDDILFAHPRAEVVRRAEGIMQTFLDRLQLRLNSDKSEDFYLTAAGRPSPVATDFRGTTEVSFLGCRVSARGTVSLAPRKTRQLLSTLRRRAKRTARALDGQPFEARGRIICGVLNRALRRKTDPALEHSVELLRRVVTDRGYLRQLDYSIARIVLGSVTGTRNVRQFRRLPYRRIRRDWGLLSLYHSRNLWAAGR